MLLIKYGQPNIDLSVPFEKKWSIIQNRYYVLSIIYSPRQQDNKERQRHSLFLAKREVFSYETKVKKRYHKREIDFSVTVLDNILCHQQLIPLRQRVRRGTIMKGKIGHCLKVATAILDFSISPNLQKTVK